jgi:hypothetical protein
MRLWVLSFQIRVRHKRYKRYKSSSHVPACRSLLDHGRYFCLVASFVETGLRLWVTSFQIKVRYKRYKRYKSCAGLPILP